MQDICTETPRSIQKGTIYGRNYPRGPNKYMSMLNINKRMKITPQEIHSWWRYLLTGPLDILWVVVYRH